MSSGDVIDWTHKWNKKADVAGLPIMIRAVYLDPECKSGDDYDVQDADKINAISLYRENPDGPGFDCVADIHDVGIAKEILNGYLKGSAYHG